MGVTYRAWTSPLHLYRASPNARVGSKPPRTRPLIITVCASSIGCSDCILKKGYQSGKIGQTSSLTSAVHWDSCPSDLPSGHRRAKHRSRLGSLPTHPRRHGYRQYTQRTNYDMKCRRGPSTRNCLTRLLIEKKHGNRRILTRHGRLQRWSCHRILAEVREFVFRLFMLCHCLGQEP